MYTGSFSIGSRTEMSFLTSTRVALVGGHSRMTESQAAWSLTAFRCSLTDLSWLVANPNNLRKH